MKTRSLQSWFPTFAIGLIIAAVCHAAVAEQIWGVNFSAFYGFNGISLDTGYLGPDSPVRLQVRAYGGFNGELLSVNMPGKATLNGCTMTTRGTAGAGNISTDFGLAYGAKAYFGIPDIALDKEIDLLPIIGLHSLDLRWTASQTFNPFLLGSSVTLRDEIAKEDVLDIDVSNVILPGVPFVAAGVTLAVDASLEVKMNGQFIHVSNPSMNIYNESTTISFCGGSTTFSYNQSSTLTDTIGFWPGLYAEVGPFRWEYAPVRFSVPIVSGGLPISLNSQTVNFDSTPTPTSLNLSVTAPTSQVQPFSSINISGTVTYNTGANVSAGTIIINTGEKTFTAMINSSGQFNQNITAPSSSRNISVTANESPYGLSASAQPYINVAGTQSGSGYTLQSCDVIYKVQGSSGSGYQWWTKDAYSTQDEFVDTLLYFTVVNQDLDVKWQYFKPDGSQFGSDQYYHVPNPGGAWYVCWSGWLINGYANSYPPGLYSVKVYINDGSGYKLVKNKYFSVQYQFTQNKMCEGVQASSPNDPINPRNVFYQTDSKAYTWANYDWVAQSLNVRWDFYEPNGSMYFTTSYTIADPTASGNVQWDWARAWGWINISGNSAQNKCGDWQVKVYLQNAANNNWEQTYTDHFQILESPNVAPTGSVSVNPPAPLEGQTVTLNVNVSDNTYLKKIVLHWNTGSQTWDNLSVASFNQTQQIGSFTAGTQIDSWVEAWDTSGNRTESQHVNFIVAAESVSIPNRPIGATVVGISQSRSYQTDGATSTFGSPVQYQFDWGDGVQSSWGATTQSKSWGANGTYLVRARARSQANTARISDWSDAIVLTVNPPVPILASVPSSNHAELWLNWTGVFNLQFRTNLTSGSWVNLGVSNAPLVVPTTGKAGFYRLQGF